MFSKYSAMKLKGKLRFVRERKEQLKDLEPQPTPINLENNFLCNLWIMSVCPVWQIIPLTQRFDDPRRSVS